MFIKELMYAIYIEEEVTKDTVISKKELTNKLRFQDFNMDINFIISKQKCRFDIEVYIRIFIKFPKKGGFFSKFIYELNKVIPLKFIIRYNLQSKKYDFISEQSKIMNFNTDICINKFILCKNDDESRILNKSIYHLTYNYLIKNLTIQLIRYSHFIFENIETEYRHFIRYEKFIKIPLYKHFIKNPVNKYPIKESSRFFKTFY